MNNKNLHHCAIAVALVAAASSAHAGVVSLNDQLDAEYKVTLSYALSGRLESRADALINGPVDPATGLPSTINVDDGDRNFGAGRAINNRLSLLGELLLRGPHYGLSLSGDGFYDFVYQGKNHNDSPRTVNKTGPANEFAVDTRFYDGHRARLLDAYAYGNFRIGPHQDLDVRIGRQVVAWGEVLFFSGMATAQAPADASKAFVPGVETKSLLLPTNQISLKLGLTDDFALLGYYKLEFKASELNPVGDFFSSTDAVGPGSEFIYVAANPLYSLPLPAPLSAPLGQLVPGTPQYWIATRGADLKPSAFGQYGAGLTYQLTAKTSVGAYYLRYHDPLPKLVLNYGSQVLVAPLASLSPVLQGALQQVEAGVLQQTGQPPPPVDQPLTSAALGIQVPVTYNVAYQSGVRMSAVSFSTQAFGLSFAGEASYRDGIDLLVNPAAPTSTVGKTTQADLSAVQVIGPRWFWDALNLVGEVGYIHVNSVTAVNGVNELSNGTGPGSRNAWAWAMLGTFEWRNVLAGWDVSCPIAYEGIGGGSPPPGTFGALWAHGDQRASLDVDLTYLQRFTVGASYSAFLGSADLARRPYADRDFVGVNVKLQF